MKRALLCFLLITALMTQLSFADGDPGEYKPVTRNADTRTAFLSSVTEKNGHVYLTADDIQWYEGEEANEKFREIERDPEMTEAPDGYYIVNEIEKYDTLEVADDAVVYMQIYNRTGNVEEADVVWNERIPLGKFVEQLQDANEMDLKAFPYHLVVQDGKVVQITQQFIP